MAGLVTAKGGGDGEGGGARDCSGATASLLATVGRYLISVPGGEPVLAAFRREALLAAPVLPAGLLLAYGHALAHGASPGRWAAGVAAVLLVLAVAWANQFQPRDTFAALVTLFVLVGAVLWVVAGYPLFRLGWLVGGGSGGGRVTEVDAPGQS